MANTKVTSSLIADNAIGIDQLNVSDGTNGQYLQTNGSGTLSFSTVSGYTDSDVESYLDGGTSTPTFSTITSEGTVTINPSSGDAVLNIQNGADTQTLRIDQNSLRTTTNSDIHIFTNGNTNQLFLNQSTGNVGIGTSNPQNKLHISGNLTIDNSSNAPYIDFVENADTTDSKARIAMDQIDGSNGQLQFYNEVSGTLGERLRILGNNLHLNGGADCRIQLGSGGVGANSISNNTVHIRGDSTSLKFMAASGGSVVFEQNGTSRFVFGTNDWYFGNYTNATETLNFRTSQNGTTKFNFYDLNSTEGCYIKHTGQSYGGIITYGARWDDDEDKMVINLRQSSAGGGDDIRVGIGTTNPTAQLQVQDDSGNVYIVAARVSQTQGQTALELRGGTGGTNWVMYQPTSSNTLTWYNSIGGVVMTLSTSGALSKNSGSFKIDHPLESKKDTHHLVHSFVEAPQADNIYRGKVDLVDGSATVNIDSVAGMTEGTFVALNREVQCFTSNESDWDAVKGSVSGNILTIECQNTSSTATVSWLVVGERQDQHMYDTEWTDENGKVITEPLKEIEEVEE